jgi:hypothetical protein
MKKIALGFAIGAAAAAGFFLISGLSRSCRPGIDPDYYVDRAVYDQAVAIRDSKIEVSLWLLAEKELERKEAEAAEHAAAGRALELERKLAAGAQAQAARDAEIARLTTDAQAAIEANPAIRALVEAFTLGRQEDRARILKLERQVAELGLPQPAGQDEDGNPIYDYPEGTVTGSLWKKLKATEVQRDESKKDFFREEGLRKSGDALRIRLERDIKGAGIWKVVALLSNAAWGAAAIF